MDSFRYDILAACRGSAERAQAAYNFIKAEQGDRAARISIVMIDPFPEFPEEWEAALRFLRGQDD